MNHHRRVVIRDKRNWIGTLRPKGTKSGYNGSNYIIENGHQIFGLKVAPKTSIIFIAWNLVSPLHSHSGRSLVRESYDAEGRGYGKKRMAARNKLHRGTYLTPKGC